MKNLIITFSLISLLCFGMSTRSYAQQSATNVITQVSEESNYIEVTQIVNVKGGASTIQLNNVEENTSLKEMSEEIKSMKSIIKTMTYLSEKGYRFIATNAVQLDGTKIATFYFQKTSK